MCAANFNHLSVTFTLARDHLTPRALLDDYFRKSLDLEIHPFVGDDLEVIFRTIDPVPKKAANRLYQDPRNRLHLAVVVEATWRAIWKSSAEQSRRDRDAALVAHSYVTYGGHFSVSAGMVTAGLEGIDRGMIEREEIARTMVRCFPQGTLLLPPEWMAKLDAEDDKLKFVAENAVEIASVSQEYFEKTGGKLKGCGALIGFSSLARIRDVITQEVDGHSVQTILVAPADGLPLEGINLWMFAWNPAKPNEALFANALIGSSPVCLATAFINTEMERDLMRTMWQTVGHAQNAQRAVVRLEDWLAKEEPTLLRRRRIYQGLEFFSQRAVEMRKSVRDNSVINPDVPVKGFTDTFESSGGRFKRLIVDGEFIHNLPDANHPPGFFVNGEPVTADNFLFLRKWNSPLGSSLDQLSSAELAMIADQLSPYCKRDFIEESMGKLRELLDPLYYSEVDANQVESYAQKYETIESLTFLNLVAKDILCNVLLKDILEAGAGKLNVHFPRYSLPDMRTVISRAVTHIMFLPLMRPHDLLAQWGYQRIRQLCLPTFLIFPQTPSPNAQLQKIATDKSHILQNIKAILDKTQSNAKNTDQMQLELQKNLKNEEKALEATIRKENGMRTAVDEMEDQDSISGEQEGSEKEVRESVIEELTRFDLARGNGWDKDEEVGT
ncbi:MAG: hypothetical protein Q9216_006830 [Gyalolechia sp. 2 TL-2023]